MLRYILNQTLGFFLFDSLVKLTFDECLRGVWHFKPQRLDE